jgi:predicted XRE-type DNA-binding protein
MNVFADLRLSNPEELLARSKVIGQIHDIIRRDKLTDETAANIMGIPVVDVDIILRGDVKNRYSKNELRRLLQKLQKATNAQKR